MRALLFVVLISLSLASLAEGKNVKTTATKKIETKKVETKHDLKKGEKNPEDCETTEELKKKLEAKPQAAAPVKVEAPKNDKAIQGLGGLSGTTGCSL